MNELKRRYSTYDLTEYFQEESGLSDGALLWMMEQVEALGLALDKSYVQHGVHPNSSAYFDNTPKWQFNIAGTAPRQFEGDVSNLHERTNSFTYHRPILWMLAPTFWNFYNKTSPRIIETPAVAQKFCPIHPKIYEKGYYEIIIYKRCGC